MTDLRKAAEMALHALKFSQNMKRCFARAEQDYHEKIAPIAIAALRQALAQPEQVSIEPPDYVEPVTYDYHEGWEKGFKDGVESVKNKKESTPSNVDPLLHGGDGNYIKQAQPEQEPVVCDCGDHITPNSGAMCGICASIKPSKPWVSLTDDEVKSILDCGRGGLVDIKKTEQLLKERNNG